MTTFKTLREANEARQKVWAAGNHISGTWRGNEMGGEIGEAVEAFLALTIAGGNAQNTIKKLEREALGIRGSRATVEDLGKELGDVIICAYLCAQYYGLDLDREVALKFNETSEKVGLQVFMEVPAC